MGYLNLVYVCSMRAGVSSSIDSKSGIKKAPIILVYKKGMYYLIENQIYSSCRCDQDKYEC